MEDLELPDGRTLEYLVEGPADGRLLVLHHGTPGGAVRLAPLADPALRLGYRVVLPGRPGYRGSTASRPTWPPSSTRSAPTTS
jgi:pimeloyl-ACP methyl ester carboxylesterase